MVLWGLLPLWQTRYYWLPYRQHKLGITCSAKAKIRCSFTQPSSKLCCQWYHRCGINNWLHNNWAWSCFLGVLVYLSHFLMWLHTEKVDRWIQTANIAFRKLKCSNWIVRSLFAFRLDGRQCKDKKEAKKKLLAGFTPGRKWGGFIVSYMCILSKYNDMKIICRDVIFLI